MDIYTAQPRDTERGRRQDQPVGHDNERIGLPGEKVGAARLVLQAQRLRNGDTVGYSGSFNGAGGDLATSALRAIGLRQNANDAVAGVQQGLERRDREIRGAGKGDA